MKQVTIKPVDKPKSFSEVDFLEHDWNAATKKGPLTLPAADAMENIKNSKGLYVIVPEKASIDVNVGGVSLNDMDTAKLKVMAASLGISLRKKSIKRSDLIALVAKKIEEDIVIDDDELVEG